MIVKDCFHTELVQIHPDALLLEAAERMLASNTETLLIMEGNRLLGVIGLRDLFTAPVPSIMATRCFTMKMKRSCLGFGRRPRCEIS
jgi:CBS domain-containing protein